MPHTLRLDLLGDFRIAYGDQILTSVSSPRLQALLAYLALHRHTPQPRRYMAFQLWPDSSEEQARTNLRKLLHMLRKGLPKADRFLYIDGQMLQWRLDAPFALDVADFENAVTQADSAASLREAVDL
jgi:DNA-binding SARP family transcriptional activator